MTTPAEKIAHEASIQEREKGQRDLVDGLRASNKALAAALLDERESLRCANGRGDELAKAILAKDERIADLERQLADAEGSLQAFADELELLGLDDREPFESIGEIRRRLTAFEARVAELESTPPAIEIGLLRKELASKGRDYIEQCAHTADALEQRDRLKMDLASANEKLAGKDAELAKWRDIGGPKRTALVEYLTTPAPTATPVTEGEPDLTATSPRHYGGLPLEYFAPGHKVSGSERNEPSSWKHGTVYDLADHLRDTLATLKTTDAQATQFVIERNKARDELDSARKELEGVRGRVETMIGEMQTRYRGQYTNICVIEVERRLKDILRSPFSPRVLTEREIDGGGE